jgi:hypothetical protein
MLTEVMEKFKPKLVKGSSSKFKISVGLITDPNTVPSTNPRLATEILVGA